MDAKTRVESLMLLWADLKSRRTRQEQQWKDIVKWIAPERNAGWSL